MDYGLHIRWNNIIVVLTIHDLFKNLCWLNTPPPLDIMLKKGTGFHSKNIYDWMVTPTWRHMLGSIKYVWERCMRIITYIHACVLVFSNKKLRTYLCVFLGDTWFKASLMLWTYGRFENHKRNLFRFKEHGLWKMLGFSRQYINYAPQRAVYGIMIRNMLERNVSYLLKLIRSKNEPRQCV